MDEELWQGEKTRRDRAHRQAEEARRHAEEARRLAAEEARHRAEEEARCRAEEEARLRAEAEERWERIQAEMQRERMRAQERADRERQKAEEDHAREEKFRREREADDRREKRAKAERQGGTSQHQQSGAPNGSAWKQAAEAYLSATAQGQEAAFPVPPHLGCSQPKCAGRGRSEALSTCEHSLEEVLRQSPEGVSAAVVHREKLLWHPDRFNTAARKKDQQLAEELFKLYQLIAEQIGG